LSYRRIVWKALKNLAHCQCLRAYCDYAGS